MGSIERDSPERPERESRLAAFCDTAVTLLANRPSASEIVLQYLPGAVLVGSLAVWGMDETCDTHIADRLASVRVEQDANIAQQTIQEIAHNIGVQAQKLEK